ncbi:hypothetical protein PAHAL_2G279000 [Panicum hallii]|uniref:Uncharacterized protein n=1 Tax=Panicum hallii TaxID=206008 RepID=A0A2T8KQP5_9POAL|nr:hypothetical protein PAHAL_2G279000 [Panicum hallii]
MSISSPVSAAPGRGSECSFRLAAFRQIKAKEQHAVPGVRPAEDGGGAARQRGPRRPAARRQAARPREARPPAAPAPGAASEVPARARAAQGPLRGHGEGARRRRGGSGGAHEGQEDGRGRDRRDGGGSGEAGGRAGGGGRRRAAVQLALLHPLIDTRDATRVAAIGSRCVPHTHTYPG